MRQKYTEIEKQKYVQLYNHGTSVKTLCRDYGLSKSTVYNWIKDYTEVKAPSGEYVTAKRLYELEKRLARINRENEIFRSSGCMPQSPIEERIQAIIRVTHWRFDAQQSTIGLSELLQKPGWKKKTIYYAIEYKKYLRTVMAGWVQRRLDTNW